jgi:hypothetical protein
MWLSHPPQDGRGEGGQLYHRGKATRKVVSSF